MDSLFTFVFKYFWFISSIIGIINYVIYRRRANKYNFESEIDQEEFNKILIGILLVMTVLPIIFGFIQLIGRFDNVFYVFSTEYTNPYLWLVWGTIIILDLVTIYWAFVKGGAASLVKYYSVLKHPRSFQIKNPSELTMKLYIILICSSNIIAYIIGSSMNLYEISGKLIDL